jgi:hypothetical protein
MSPDRNQIVRRRKLTQRSYPLDQTPRNLVLLCLALQFIPFVTGRKPSGLLAKFLDLIAQAIHVKPVVQDRKLPDWHLSLRYERFAGRFQAVWPSCYGSFAITGAPHPLWNG